MNRVESIYDVRRILLHAVRRFTPTAAAFSDLPGNARILEQS